MTERQKKERIEGEKTKEREDGRRRERIKRGLQAD